MQLYSSLFHFIFLQIDGFVKNGKTSKLIWNGLALNFELYKCEECGEVKHSCKCVGMSDMCIPQNAYCTVICKFRTALFVLIFKSIYPEVLYIIHYYSSLKPWPNALDFSLYNARHVCWVKCRERLATLLSEVESSVFYRVKFGQAQNCRALSSVRMCSWSSVSSEQSIP